jgi:hypothetical protein
MTESYYKRVPGWRDVDFAVKTIVRGLERDRGLIAFPWYSDVLARWISGLPEPMRNWVFMTYIRKSRNSGDIPAI